MLPGGAAVCAETSDSSDSDDSTVTSSDIGGFIMTARGKKACVRKRCELSCVETLCHVVIQSVTQSRPDSDTLTQLGQFRSPIAIAERNNMRKQISSTGVAVAWNEPLIQMAHIQLQCVRERKGTCRCCVVHTVTVHSHRLLLYVY